MDPITLTFLTIAFTFAAVRWLEWAGADGLVIDGFSALRRPMRLEVVGLLALLVVQAGDAWTTAVGLARGAYEANWLFAPMVNSWGPWWTAVAQLPILLLPGVILLGRPEGKTERWWYGVAIVWVLVIVATKSAAVIHNLDVISRLP